MMTGKSFLKKPIEHCRVRCNFEGNRGGSFVAITGTTEGMVLLEVGESCVNTVCQEISVAALAAILTAAKDKGFQQVVDDYLALGGGQPVIHVHKDVHKDLP